MLALNEESHFLPWEEKEGGGAAVRDRDGELVERQSLHCVLSIHERDIGVHACTHNA